MWDAAQGRGEKTARDTAPLALGRFIGRWEGTRPGGTRWQPGARKGCARDRARFGGNPAPTLWDATFKSVPQRGGVNGRARPGGRAFGTVAQRRAGRHLEAFGGPGILSMR